MKRSPKKLHVAMVLVFLITGACVTINIYFPAEKVESVAGEIVQEIRGKEEEHDTETDSNTQGSLTQPILWALSPSVAWAQDVQKVDNAAIRSLKQKMKARYGRMKPFFQKGSLKEGGDGYVAVQSTGGLSVKQKRDVKALVSAENKDRRQLYAEVAKALKIDPGQMNRVAEIFAKEWQKYGR